LLLKDRSNLNLSEEHIVIVGCGGIGNFMSYPLSTLALGEITLIDADSVEESNLNRQFMFCYDDIGKSKADILSKKIRSYDRNITINKYQSKVNESILEEIFMGKKTKYKPSLIILSADDDYCLRLIRDNAIKYRIPYINIGYLNDYSVIGPFYVPNVSGCNFCSDTAGLNINNDVDEDIKMKMQIVNKIHKTPAFYTNNSFAASMALIDILFYYAGEYENINSLNRRVGIDNHDFTRYYLDIPKNPNCDCNLKNR